MRWIAVRAFALWLPIAVASTGLAGLVYVTVQQNYRQSANDPQLQMARDSAARLSSGAAPADVVGDARVDLARSLAPYRIVYDDRGGVLASSGTLDGHVPRPPLGVLQTAADRGEDTLTWQPRPGVRSAVDVVSWSSGGASGTVLAGRSLVEVEQRENELTLTVGAGWAAVLGASAVAAVVGAWLWGLGLGRSAPPATEAPRR
jgi:hypothetical protein